MDFLKELESLKSPVWRVLRSYLPDKYPKRHYEMVRDYPERQGKYLRPGLLLLSTGMLEGSQKKALLLAAAIQASEDWLLIHDDVEDRSQFRRSTPTEPKPTLNSLYGDELAINAGDSLHVIMWRIMIDAAKELEGKLGWHALQKMVDILQATIEGQYLDISWIRDNNFTVSSKDYYKMVSLKTVNYTVTGPLQLGAIAAGQVSSKTFSSLKSWGEPLGKAFQVRDDIINITSASNILGKEQGGDIIEGKRTLLLVHLLSKCTSSENSYIQAIYRKSSKSKTEVEKQYIMELMKKYGSIDYAVKEAEKLCNQAKTLFKKHSKTLPDTKEKLLIEQFINYVSKRNY
jgi:geranylgeranyl diphosphate synthase type II